MSREPDVLTALDQVEDRDRVILAMMLERVHPDDIAATLGISGAALRTRRTRMLKRLTDGPAQQRPSPPAPRRATTALTR